MEINTGLLYMLLRRSNDQNEYARQQLNLLREHQGLPPIPSRWDTPAAQRLNHAMEGGWCGMFAGYGALAGATALGGVLAIWLMAFGPEYTDIGEHFGWEVVIPLMLVGAFYGWIYGWRIGRWLSQIV